MEHKTKRKKLKTALQRLVHWAKEFARAEEAYLNDNDECGGNQNQEKGRSVKDKAMTGGSRLL